MAYERALRQLSEYVFEIPVGFREDMRVPARLYADNELAAMAAKDRSLAQLVNVACLPGVVGYALAMPDIHEGYGFPIGGVAATDGRHGVISPGGVGYDINCGVRLLASNLDADEVRPFLGQVMDAIAAAVPAGVGVTGEIRLAKVRLDDVLEGGAQWAVSAGFGRREDIDHCEADGRLEWARASAVSARARERGREQVGTLGAGNHFIELSEVVQVFDAGAADVFGLRPGQLVVQLHSGSRGLGHQVATDFVRSFQAVVRREGYQLPDRELVCAPLGSSEGQDYLAAMSAAANFAWANRLVMSEILRRACERALAGKVRAVDLRLVYDVAHNVAKLERHTVHGKATEVCVHRKGATRAFPAGHKELPSDYIGVGQPVLVPGDMGTASYVLVGTEKAMSETFGSCCHGAGRVLSRSAARKEVNSLELRRSLEAQGITIRAHNLGSLAEEAPAAYKDVERVVSVVEGAGLARRVARLIPLGVVKG